MTRLHLEVSMSSAVMMEVKIADMGFGEFAKSSGLTFNQQIDLSVGG